MKQSEPQRWRRFAENLVSGQSATDAYLAAGYKSSRRHAAETAASRLRRVPKVAAYIAELHEFAIQEARQDARLSLRETLNYLTRVVRTSAADLKEDDELIQYARTFQDGTKAIRIPDKLRALKLHAQLVRHLEPPPLSTDQPAYKDTLLDFLHQLRSGAPSTHPSTPAKT